MWLSLPEPKTTIQVPNKMVFFKLKKMLKILQKKFLDHRAVSHIVKDCAYMLGVPNIVTDAEPIPHNPVFLFREDPFDKPLRFEADIAVDITDVFYRKVYALESHHSQFDEWMPYMEGSELKGHEWIIAHYNEMGISKATRKGLEKYYGRDHAQKVKYAEAFQISEYGSQPNEDLIYKLFPMLPKKEKSKAK